MPNERMTHFLLAQRGANITLPAVLLLALRSKDIGITWSWRYTNLMVIGCPTVAGPFRAGSEGEG